MALTVTTPEPLLEMRTVNGSDCEPTRVLEGQGRGRQRQARVPARRGRRR